MRLQQEEENKRKEIFTIAGIKGALTRWYVTTPPAAFLPCEVASIYHQTTPPIPVPY
jgi:hypothetical protein